MFRKFPTRRLTQSLSVLSLIAAAQAHGQAVERHLPETPQNAPTHIAVPNAVPGDQDTTPIGPALRGLVLLGSQEAVHDGVGAGVTVGEITRLKNDADVAALLRPYLGQPLSRHLIAEIEAAIARHYRDLNYPFVSLSTPQQEITGGVLQIRVIEFTAGKIVVAGTGSEAEAARLRHDVALNTGDSIDARALTYDLDWINRYPFRNVQAVFAPGATLGVSDLTLEAREAKPWQAYAGYSNDGSPSTGFDRYFAGGAIGNLLGADSVLSAQTTVSRDVFQGDSDAHYKSAALSYTLPIGPRGQIEASADAVDTYQLGDPFSVRLKADEGSLGYRFAVSDFYGDTGETDLRIGVEAKHQTGITYFGGLDVYDVSVEVYQAYLGYHLSDHDALGTSTFDFALHLSPGGVDHGNDDAQALLYSQGRQKGETYSYIGATYNRITLLPAGLLLKTDAIGQFAAIALPRTEQAGLGGSMLVRGYTLDDGAFDTALIVRNELHMPGVAWRAAQFSPFVFTDLGYGRDNAAHTTSGLASAGAGAETHLTRYVSLNISAACTLAPDHETRAGNWLAHTNLSVAF
jgi:hemolysin activation/secretion protein